MRKVDCTEQPVMNSSVAELRRSSKALSKAKLAPKIAHGPCLVVCASLIHYSFLCLGESITSKKFTQQIDEMHQKLQCLQPEPVNKKDPILLHDDAQPHVVQPVLQTLNKLGCEVLPRPPYSPDLSPADYHFFKHLDNFIQDKLFHSQQDAENAFQ